MFVSIIKDLADHSSPNLQTLENASEKSVGTSYMGTYCTDVTFFTRIRCLIVDCLLFPPF